MAGEQVVVGLDIGTTKVCTLIGELRAPMQVQIVGVGIAPSRGLKKGVVVDMEEAAGAISASLKKAEVFSGYRIIGAFVAISGGHLASEVVHTDLSMPGGRTVSPHDLLQLLSSARSKPLPHGRQLLHVIPRSYRVDGENGIRNPVGMLASILETDSLLVTSAATPIQNLVRCVEGAGVQVDGLVSAGLASAHGVLSDPEKQLGVLLMDVGGGTTDLVRVRNGEAEYVGVLPLGGNHVSNDISVGLGVPFSAAEEMKIRFGNAVPANVTVDETIDAGSFSDGQVRKVSRRFMAEIIEARLLELFELAGDELERRGFGESLPAGVVLTGGTAQMRGIRELAQQTFDVPVRVGSPEGLAGTTDSIDNPAYATGAGLLKWIMAQNEDLSSSRPMRRKTGTLAKMKSLLKVFFP